MRVFLNDNENYSEIGEMLILLSEGDYKIKLFEDAGGYKHCIISDEEITDNDIMDAIEELHEGLEDE